MPSGVDKNSLIEEISPTSFYILKKKYTLYHIQ